MHIRCPHCHNPIQLVDDRPDEVVCPGCGSSFRVEGSPLPTTEEQLRTVLGGTLQIMERVGVGGFGSVYRARDTQLDRIVAVKIAHPSLLGSDHDPGAPGFFREARAAARLRHPEIVPVPQRAYQSQLAVTARCGTTLRYRNRDGEANQDGR